MKILSLKAYKAMKDAEEKIRKELNDVKKRYDKLLEDHEKAIDKISGLNNEIVELRKTVLGLTPKRDSKGRYVKRS